MKAILQRVTMAKVEVDSKTVGEIGTGFLILLGETRCERELGKKPWTQFFPTMPGISDTFPK